MSTTYTQAPEPLSPIFDGTKLGQEIALETEAINAGVHRYRRLTQQTIARGDGASLKPAERFLLHWFQPMVEEVRQEQRGCRRGEVSTGRHIYGPILLLLDPERVASITLHECLSQCMRFPTGVLVSKLAYSVGAAVIAEISMDILKETQREDYDELMKRVKRLTPGKARKWTNKHLKDPVWNRRVCVHLGARLLWAVQSCASAADYGPDSFKLAFRRKIRQFGKKNKAFFVMDHSVYRQIEEGHGLRQYMRPRYLPMIVQPLPLQQIVGPDGTKTIEGGYARIRTSLTTKPIRAQKEALKAADLTRVLAGLNVLGKTRWAKNDSTHIVIEEIIRRGGGIAGIPRQDDIPMPPKPTLFAADPAIKKAWKVDAAKTHRENAKTRADRAEMCHLLGVVDLIQNHREFYLPHQLCFRGRAYPIPQYLNHHGDDVARSLLRFARPKDASSDTARFWLYVHAANCAGHDKISFEDRVKWTDSWIREYQAHKWIGSDQSIVDVAQETWAFDNKRDHRHIDNPLQFLAAVLAIYDPVQAATLPIQRDGTANALQHYAALALDPIAAAMVNMVDSEAPTDPYTLMVRRIAEVVRADAQKQNDTAALARHAMDFLVRSVLKRPGMTKYYGVTMVGAREQIAGEIQSLIKNDLNHPLHENKLLFQVSMYLARIALKVFETMFESSESIMLWLQESAKAIAKSGKLVRWTTPLGFPVVQPYRKAKKITVVTCLQKIIVAVEDDTRPVMVHRQSSACPPNVIHSFDQTHQAMTAIACDPFDIELGTVHDNDWMHAANVETVDQILREQFVRLHSEPLLEKLAEEWRALYPGVEIKAPPARGDFDLNNVLKARYFFS